MSELNSRTCTRVDSVTCRTWVNDFQRHARESVRCFHLEPFLSQVNWLLRFLTVRPWDPLSEPLTCLDKGSETGGFSRVLGVVGIISIFMYKGNGDQLLNRPTAAVVIFFLLMHICAWNVCRLLSLTPFLWYDTHTHTQADTHTLAQIHACTHTHTHTTKRAV